MLHSTAPENNVESLLMGNLVTPVKCSYVIVLGLHFLMLHSIVLGLHYFMLHSTAGHRSHAGLTTSLQSEMSM